MMRLQLHSSQVIEKCNKEHLTKGQEDENFHYYFTVLVNIKLSYAESFLQNCLS